MLRFLRSLFKGKGPLIRASLSGDAAQFSQVLMRSKVVVIHAELGEGLSFSASEGEVLRAVEKAARGEPADPRFFAYQDEGKAYFPFFLSESDAMRFCGAYSGRENTLYAYQLMEVPGSVVVQGIGQYEMVVMNPQGDDEFTLSGEFLSTLRGLATSKDSEARMRRLSVCFPHPSIRV